MLVSVTPAELARIARLIDLIRCHHERWWLSQHHQRERQAHPTDADLARRQAAEAVLLRHGQHVRRLRARRRPQQFAERCQLAAAVAIPPPIGDRRPREQPIPTVAPLPPAVARRRARADAAWRRVGLDPDGVRQSPAAAYFDLDRRRRVRPSAALTAAATALAQEIDQAGLSRSRPMMRALIMATDITARIDAVRAAEARRRERPRRISQQAETDVRPIASAEFPAKSPMRRRMKKLDDIEPERPPSTVHPTATPTTKVMAPLPPAGLQPPSPTLTISPAADAYRTAEGDEHRSSSPAAASTSPTIGVEPRPVASVVVPIPQVSMVRVALRASRSTPPNQEPAVPPPAPAVNPLSVANLRKARREAIADAQAARTAPSAAPPRATPTIGPGKADVETAHGVATQPAAAPPEAEAGHPLGHEPVQTDAGDGMAYRVRRALADTMIADIGRVGSTADAMPQSPGDARATLPPPGPPEHGGEVISFAAAAVQLRGRHDPTLLSRMPPGLAAAKVLLFEITSREERPAAGELDLTADLVISDIRAGALAPDAPVIDEALSGTGAARGAASVIARIGVRMLAEVAVTWIAAAISVLLAVASTGPAVPPQILAYGALWLRRHHPGARLSDDERRSLDQALDRSAVELARLGLVDHICRICVPSVAADVLTRLARLNHVGDRLDIPPLARERATAPPVPAGAPVRPRRAPLPPPPVQTQLSRRSTRRDDPTMT